MIAHERVRGGHACTPNRRYALSQVFSKIFPFNIYRHEETSYSILCNARGNSVLIKDNLICLFYRCVASKASYTTEYECER